MAFKGTKWADEVPLKFKRILNFLFAKYSRFAGDKKNISNFFVATLLPFFLSLLHQPCGSIKFRLPRFATLARQQESRCGRVKEPFFACLSGHFIRIFFISVLSTLFPLTCQRTRWLIGCQKKAKSWIFVHWLLYVWLLISAVFHFYLLFLLFNFSISAPLQPPLFQKPSLTLQHFINFRQRSLIFSQFAMCDCFEQAVVDENGKTY